MSIPRLLQISLMILVTASVSADDWPMYRSDSGRTATLSSEMPSELQLRWKRQLPALTPAFHSERLQFDAGYEPVSADGVLLIASSQTDSVTAYDTMTGDQRWTFHTNGPVRCAPAIWHDRACFGSDDGHLYCVDLLTGELRWKHRAAPSDRRVLGNQRLISVWPVRGGPVVADGRVYFAAGVWPFEGVFVYAMEIETGKVVWRNDRMGYLFGQHPHNTEAIGGLAPQGYLLIDKDELIVPCSTAFPARLNRHDGSLIDFELPGPGRLPGGWFSQLDTDTARALRRGTIAFDDVVNRQQHEDKDYKASGGVSGLSRQIRLGDTPFHFDDGFPGVDGSIHSMIVADGQVFVVTREGSLSCFSAKADSGHEVKHWRPRAKQVHCAQESIKRAKQLASESATDHGIAFVLGLKSGQLVHALVQNSNYQVVGFDDDLTRVQKLRGELEDAGVSASRASIITCDLSNLHLPPYLATLITTERDRIDVPSVLEALHPFGGIAALGQGMTGEADSQQFVVESVNGQGIVRRVGAIPGSRQYPGNWGHSEDELVRFPLGVLWFDDSLAHFKRSPQPRFLQDVMISRPKNWHRERHTDSYKVDYPLLPFALSDIYTGRVLADEEKLDLRKTLAQSDPSKLEPSQYRPPRQTNPGKPDQPVVGQRTNPLTGLQEPRVFPKTYGCDGGVDYGLLYTLRSGTPAYYDKTIESGTVFLSGPRSGCTNSIIPSGGLLNVPYFYEGCTCSYPLPSALSLMPMPQRFEQWSSWGKMKIQPDSIQQIGLNFGAPGDRMTREGTLWLDYPSVGGPSPAIDVEQSPENLNYRYYHSMWMSQEDEQPWVTASMAEGLESVIVKDLKPGKYQVILYFAEPDYSTIGQRVQNVWIQDVHVLKKFDILAASHERMKGVAIRRDDIDISGTFKVKLTPVKGETLISGVELRRQPTSD
ncbi:MAG: PQQ-binding-like beta-propeller repeat protein [Rubripirellula sp.]